MDHWVHMLDPHRPSFTRLLIEQHLDDCCRTLCVSVNVKDLKVQPNCGKAAGVSGGVDLSIGLGSGFRCSKQWSDD